MRRLLFLFEARIGLLKRDRETRQLIVEITLADSEIEPAGAVSAAPIGFPSAGASV
jgi:hypothetical protein